MFSKSCPSQSDRPHVLLIGDPTPQEFQQPLAWLRAVTALSVVSGIEAALQAIARDLPTPEVIVLAQTRPGQFGDKDVERLHHAAPLARLVALLGSWCEGELRSGRPWSGVLRIYWHQWLPRSFYELLHAMPSGRASSWSLPRTATLADQTLHLADAPATCRGGLIAIDTRRHVDYEVLADACQQAGFSATWITQGHLSGVRGAALVLCDRGIGSRAVEADVQELAATFSGAPILVLLDFPRIQDYQRLTAAGGVSVLGKPLLMEDLLAEMERVLGPVQDRKRAA